MDKEQIIQEAVEEFDKKFIGCTCEACGNMGGSMVCSAHQFQEHTKGKLPSLFKDFLRTQLETAMRQVAERAVHTTQDVTHKPLDGGLKDVGWGVGKLDCVQTLKSEFEGLLGGTDGG